MGRCATINLLPDLAGAIAVLLFLRPSRLGGEGNPYFCGAPFDCQANGLDAGVGKRRMARLNALLRSTRSRLGERLSQIVAIAAASLPAAGA